MCWRKPRPRAWQAGRPVFGRPGRSSRCPLRGSRGPDLPHAVRNPVDDERLGPAAPEGAGEGVARGRHRVQRNRGRRRVRRDRDRGRRTQLPVIGCQPQDVVARRGKPGRRRRRQGVAEGHSAWAGVPAPANGRAGLRLAVVLHRGIQVRLPGQYDHPVRAGVHRRGEIGRASAVVDPPFQQARGELLLAVKLQPQAGRGYILEVGGFALAGGQAEAARAGHRDEGTAVPVLQPARLRQAHAALVVEPIHIHPVGLDGPAPVILHPLRAALRPVAVGPAALVIRVGRGEAVVEGREGLVAGDKGGRGGGHHGQVRPRPGIGGDRGGGPQGAGAADARRDGGPQEAEGSDRHAESP